MQEKNNIISQIALSHFNKQALDDKVLLKLFGDAVKDKAMALYDRFIEMGKKEGAIDRDIPTEAAVSYMMMTFSVLQSPDFLTTPDKYKMGMMKLFLYGLVGSENGS